MPRAADADARSQRSSRCDAWFKHAQTCPPWTSIPTTSTSNGHKAAEPRIAVHSGSALGSEQRPSAVGSLSGLTHSQREEVAGCSRRLSQWASQWAPTGSACLLTARLHSRSATAAVPGLGCWGVSPDLAATTRSRG